MKRAAPQSLILGIVMSFTLVAAGCLDVDVVGPSCPAADPTPAALHHGIPATTDDGRLVFVCTTQIRQYVSQTGRSTWERDHYISATPCPTTPIE